MPNFRSFRTDRPDLVDLGSSYRNVYRARKAQKKYVLSPLGRFLPFLITTGFHLAWLAGSGPLSGKPYQAYILRSDLFLPFLLFWGCEFAHQVGRPFLPVPHWRSGKLTGVILFTYRSAE